MKLMAQRTGGELVENKFIFVCFFLFRKTRIRVYRSYTRLLKFYSFINLCFLMKIFF